MPRQFVRDHRFQQARDRPVIAGVSRGGSHLAVARDLSTRDGTDRFRKRLIPDFRAGPVGVVKRQSKTLVARSSLRITLLYTRARQISASISRIGKKLHSVSHAFGAHLRSKAQNAAQLFANQEPLLWRQNHACVFSPGAHPLRVQPMEIVNVERVNDTPTPHSDHQLFLVRFLSKASIQSRNHRNATSTKGGDKIAVHRVLVDVDLDPIQRSGSELVSLLEDFRLMCLSIQIRVNLRLVGVVIGKGGVNLHQRQMSELPHDLFGNQAHVVPLSDSAN